MEVDQERLKDLSDGLEGMAWHLRNLAKVYAEAVPAFSPFIDYLKRKQDEQEVS